MIGAPTAAAPSAPPPGAALRRGRAEPASLPTYRVNLMRVGYLMMGVGLAVVKWPSIPNAASLPVYEGVVVALLTAVSLLAFLGVKHPLELVPLLVFESAWKLLWLAAVATPHLIAGDVDAEMRGVLSSVLVVAVILAVTPWDHVWKRYFRARGEPWR